MKKDQLKLLIIEDDLIIAQNLKENLALMGYGDAEIAPNSDSAINTFIKEKYDLCLVDIKLNHSSKDGIETVTQMNEIEKVPVIYLTSFADDLTRERAKKTNPAAYLIKPASKAQIDVAIDMALNNFYNNKKQEFHSAGCPVLSGKGFIFYKINDRYEKLYINNISAIKAERSYSILYAGNKTPVISMYLHKLMPYLEGRDIIRCHRSYAVNIHHIHSFDKNQLYVENGKELLDIPVGDQYRTEVFKLLPKV